MHHRRHLDHWVLADAILSGQVVYVLSSRYNQGLNVAHFQEQAHEKRFGLARHRCLSGKSVLYANRSWRARAMNAESLLEG